MIRFYRASVVVFAMIGLLSGSALSLSAPIVVESRSTELKDRFQERVGAGQGAAEVPVDTFPRAGWSRSGRRRGAGRHLADRN